VPIHAMLLQARVKEEKRLGLDKASSAFPKAYIKASKKDSSKQSIYDNFS
jgi:hypothetical protein